MYHIARPHIQSMYYNVTYITRPHANPTGTFTRQFLEDDSDTTTTTTLYGTGPPALPAASHPGVLLPGEEFRFEDTVKHWGDYLKVS